MEPLPDKSPVIGDRPRRMTLNCKTKLLKSMNLTAHGKAMSMEGLLPVKSAPGGFTEHNERHCFRSKMLLVMRLTAILLLTATLHVSATGFTQTVTISRKNARLEEIFDILQKQTGYNFMFNSHMLARAKKVNVQVSNATVEQVLVQCFRDQPLTYVIQDKIIVIKEKEEKKEADLNAGALAPPHIRGTVRDETNAPVEGAAVTVKGLSAGTVTNKQGKFELNLPVGTYQLEISFVGYKTVQKTVTVSGDQPIDLSFTLQVSATGLVDAVVVGYGTQRKEMLPVRSAV